MSAKQMIDQQRQICFVLPQGRKVDVKHVQTEIQILAQMAVGDSLFGIFVGGGEHAHVHRRFHFAAETPDFVIFEHAQEFRLGRRRHLADFVEQQRAAMRQFKAADAAFGGARERAFLVPENFAFHSDSGIAEQLMATNGRSARGESM